MKQISTFLALLITGVLVVFILQNLRLIELDFLTFKKNLPLSLFTIVVYILGAFTGGLIFNIFKKSLKKEKDEEL